jgi:predicted deacetylase
MKVCLDLHDFSYAKHRLELLMELKKRYSDFKVSLFTVPRETRYGQITNKNQILKKIKSNLDWIQLVPHGLHHQGSEMRHCDYDTFKNKIMPAIKSAFDEDGLPFARGFCAPHWRWTKGVVRALGKAGWWGAVDQRQPKMLSSKKFYRYSHCLDKPFWDDFKLKLLKLHGHTFSSSNDLVRCIVK